MIATLILALAADPAARIVHFHAAELAAGGRIAWVQSVNGADGPLPQKTQLFIGAPGGEPRRVTACPGRDCDEGQPAWASAGKRLAFLSDGASPGQQQLFVADDGGLGQPVQVTSLKGALADPRWAPTDDRVAFLLLEGVTDEKGPLATAPRETGVMDEAIGKRQRIAIAEAKANGAVKQVSPRDLHVYEFDWSPQGDAFAAVAARGPGDQSWWIAQLFLLGADGGETTLRMPRWQIAHPRFSPDGKRIAFIEGLMSDEDLVGGDIFIIDRDGGEAKNLTPGMRASASSLQWISPTRLLSAAWIGAGSGAITVDPGGWKVDVLWARDEHLGPTPYSLSLSALPGDGGVAAVVGSFDRPPEIYTGPLRDRERWTPRTTLNQVVRFPHDSARLLTWQSDGNEVRGWLLSPQKAADRKALIAFVHGGPAWSVTPGYIANAEALVARGYHVLMPDPRGSFGNGEDFVLANRRDFGGGDLRDILAGVDAALAAVPSLDPKRVGMFGWSYGGFMAMFAPAQTDRFRAVVAGAGITNWKSYYGTNRIDTWMVPYFGKSVYDEPEPYLKCSAIEQPKKLRTPTLLLHGERDSEVPVGQSLEHWHALRANHTPTQLVIYADEGHVPQKPEHQADIRRRTADWFDRYLTPAR